MAIDFSNVNSVFSKYTAGEMSASELANSLPNFEDYILSAQDASRNKKQKNENSLYQLISNSSNSSVMQSLLGSKNSAVLMKYMDSDKMSSSLSPFTTNTTGSSTTLTTEMFSDYLQSNFSATMLKSMNDAKTKLQADYEAFRAANRDNNSEAVKARIDQMQQNIEAVQQFIDSKTNKTSANEQLRNQLSTNSAYLQYSLTTK